MHSRHLHQPPAPVIDQVGGVSSLLSAAASALNTCSNAYANSSVDMTVRTSCMDVYALRNDSAISTLASAPAPVTYLPAAGSNTQENSSADSIVLSSGNGVCVPSHSNTIPTLMPVLVPVTDPVEVASTFPSTIADESNAKQIELPTTQLKAKDPEISKLEGKIVQLEESLSPPHQKMQKNSKSPKSAPMTM